MPSRPRLLSSLFSAALLALAACPISVSAAEFSDVPKSHFAHDAIIYLANRDIFAGYSDGTFKPDAKVNRAEALKIIASNFIPKSQTVRVKSVDFTDVPDDAWYLPSLVWALPKKIVNGPPAATSFYPTRTVTKIEFLKMLFTAYGVDPKSFNDIALPLSSDVTDVKAWYYPSMRYAVATATTIVPESGVLGPARELTRADVALLLYRFTLYRDGQRTQELLTETKKDVERIITFLAKGDVRSAEYASARAILIARGALQTDPDAPIVKVAVKIAEGYRALTRAYRASLNSDLDSVRKLAADAATLAGQARKLSGEAKVLADQLEKYAKSFSDQARK
ncbi:MAG: S-layer homology domain-containing protein [Candidatus Peribacteraceae bacterium]|nr:S-layer homology domain-containing protein [Candidatus Peribacteraceae bacterium]